MAKKYLSDYRPRTIASLVKRSKYPMRMTNSDYENSWNWQQYWNANYQRALREWREYEATIAAREKEEALAAIGGAETLQDGIF